MDRDGDVRHPGHHLTSPECWWTSTSCSTSSSAGGSGSPIDSPPTGWTDRAYYRGRFIDQTIDNPDQRIQQDIDVFTTGTGPETNTPTVGTSTTLLFGAVNSIVSVVAFAPILWNLSGPLTILGFTIPKALFWMVWLYVFFATVVAFWIGRPLIRLSFRNEATNAAFRYALVRLRDAAEAVGFYRGERAERRTLASRFAVDHPQLPGVRPTRYRLPRLEPDR